jgi:hypothetical protein
MRLRLNINTAGFERFLDKVDESLAMTIDSPLENAMGDAMDLYMQAMRDRFALYSQRGGTWAEHAPSTIKRRGPDAPILIVTGALENSLERDMPNHVLEFTDHSVIEGTEDPVARYQHSGTATIPARPIIVEPPIQTLDAMKEELRRGFKIALLVAAHS